MSSRTLTNTNVSNTYLGVIHARGAQLPPTGQERLFDGFGNRTSLSIGRDCNGATVCGNLSADSIQTQNISVQDLSNIFNIIYPIGSVLFSADEINPGTRFVTQTWVRISQGRFIAGIGTGTDNNNISQSITQGNNNGAYNASAVVPPHWHGVGTFTRNNDVALIRARGGTARWQGWVPDTLYHTAECVGEGSNQRLENTTIWPPTDRGVITSHPITDGGDAESTSADNKPPGFGLYVWQRTN
jgi:hypothetical protein